jgi:polyvinyl alcohol dehydrogenase (cytochrome)
MRATILTLVMLVMFTGAAAAQPQAGGQPDGSAVFERACATCHQANQNAVPPPEAMRTLTPEAIVNSLTIGRMAVEGAGLTPSERNAVATFLTGRAPMATTSSAPANRCTAATPAIDPARAPSWMAWGNDATNSRFAPTGGLTAADLPRLELKWAFGYEGATSSRVQPALAGGKLFVASDNGELHALDPRTGCTYWTFRADAGVRSALTVGPYRTAGDTRYAVFFGDQRANAYAVDTMTGQRVWQRRIDDHPAAAITGALTVADGKVFVPTQGLNEEGTGGRGQAPCCTFRGSLSALDASTGAVFWTTYMIDEPRLRGRNTRSGADAFGPAGGAIWAAATADLARRQVYVTTGNAYADPPQKMTNAVVAMDIDSGRVKWFYQGTPNDVWLGGCGRTSGGNPGCPEVQGPDFDFSVAPLLATVNGQQLVIAPQKSGIVHALNPDTGAVVWQERFGAGSGLGGQWGAAFDGEKVYIGVGSFLTPTPGGVVAFRAETGEQVWSVPPPQPPLCAGQPRCNPSQAGATTAIPGAVLAVSLDGGLRAYAAADGKIIWEFDTNGEFETVNGVKGTGASIDGSPLIVGDGMIFVNSGYGGIAARPGNVLLVFGVK